MLMKIKSELAVIPMQSRQTEAADMPDYNCKHSFVARSLVWKQKITVFSSPFSVIFMNVAFCSFPHRTSQVFLSAAKQQYITQVKFIF